MRRRKPAVSKRRTALAIGRLLDAEFATEVGLAAIRPGRYHRYVTMTPSRQVKQQPENLTTAVCLFRSLADPTRLAIVRRLALGDHRVVELTEHLGLAQSTVSAHLACLRDCGLVTSRPSGRASMFSLARPELFDLLAAAERVLAATGEAVALCPNYGQAAHG